MFLFFFFLLKEGNVKNQNYIQVMNSRFVWFNREKHKIDKCWIHSLSDLHYKKKSASAD